MIIRPYRKAKNLNKQTNEDRFAIPLVVVVDTEVSHTVLIYVWCIEVFDINKTEK